MRALQSQRPTSTRAEVVARAAATSRQDLRCKQRVTSSLSYKTASDNGLVRHLDAEMKAVLQHGSLIVNFTAPQYHDVNHCLPHLLHFIWTGSKLPSKYMKNLDTFANQLPNFEIWLWVDVQPLCKHSNVVYKQLGMLKFATRDLLFGISSPVERGDVMLYEIVYQFGGIYVDIDMTCQKPFDELLDLSFVSHTFGVYNNIQNAMSSFPPRSHFLHYVISCVVENYHNFNAKSDTFLPNRTGPPFFTACFHQYNDNGVVMIDQDLLMGSRRDSYVHYNLDSSWQ